MLSWPATAAAVYQQTTNPKITNHTPKNNCTLHTPQETTHTTAVFFEARRRKRGSTIQSYTNGNFRWSYISLWLWWRQMALKLEGREWGSMPSVVRSTHVANFLACSRTPSSSYCSILIYKYFMINLTTFFWTQKTIRLTWLKGNNRSSAWLVF